MQGPAAGGGDGDDELGRAPAVGGNELVGEEPAAGLVEGVDVALFWCAGVAAIRSGAAVRRVGRGRV